MARPNPYHLTQIQDVIYCEQNICLVDMRMHAAQPETFYFTHVGVLICGKNLQRHAGGPAQLLRRVQGHHDPEM